MITLKTSILTENLGFNGEDIQVKSISAAWNKIREIRDTTDPNLLNSTILVVEFPQDDDQMKMSGRLPEKILFKLNTKGKIEFKDFAKVESRQKNVKETADKTTEE